MGHHGTCMVFDSFREGQHCNSLDSYGLIMSAYRMIRAARFAVLLACLYVIRNNVQISCSQNKILVIYIRVVVLIKNIIADIRVSLVYVK